MKKSKNLKKLLASMFVFFTLLVFIAIPGFSADSVVKVTLLHLNDIIPPGKITEYDFIRIMPFGGDVISVKMRGRLLKHVLDQGRKNRGTGGYLQTANVSLNEDGSKWLIKGKKLKSGKKYSVAINDFLLAGKESGLDYLTQDNTNITDVRNHGDIRKALISRLQKIYGGNNTDVK